MKTKERVIWIIFFVILIMTFLFTNQGYRNELKELEEANIKLMGDRERLMQLYKDNAATIGNLKTEIEKHNEILETQNISDKVIMSSLREKGFTGELEDIVTDLQTHKELIPYAGGLGGTMDFYSDKDIHVLTDKWVFAYFEDGHIFGYMLLEYDIEDGSIVWEVIDSYLFQ